MVYLIPFLASCAAFMCGVSTMSEDLALSSESGLYDVVGAIVKRVVTAINDNHAVQALGWDMLISISSRGLLYLLRRSLGKSNQMSSRVFWEFVALKTCYD